MEEEVSETEEDIQVRRAQRSEIQRQINESMSVARERALNREEKKVERKASFDTDKYCSDDTKVDFTGESIASSTDIVLFVDPLTEKDKILYYCFTAEELFNSFVSSRRLWKWERGPILNEPIFKIPMSYG